MAICNECGQNMSDAKTISCKENVKVDFGDCVADPIRYGYEESEFRENRRWRTYT